MAKIVELMRHTAADGDVLTGDGIGAALEIGTRLGREYDVVISSGAQRATQTAACVLAGSGQKVPAGVVVDPRFHSDVEDRWRAAYEAAGSGDIESLQKADPDLVEKESQLLASALADIFHRLPEGGRALVVGHSPMQEAAVYGLTGVAVEPLPKGGGVRVIVESGTYSVEALDH
jgi:broad specificity phosphatase PhoE